jgi:hypothetical protein
VSADEIVAWAYLGLLGACLAPLVLLAVLATLGRPR